MAVHKTLTGEGDNLMFSHPISKWRRWFAWRPVYTFDLQWVWLQTVERRACQCKYGSLSQWVQYRLPEKP